MSEFHLITLGVALAIVAAVWGFNIWQEHRFKKRAAAAFSRNHPDVLLETPKNNVRPGESVRRVEPSMGAGQAAIEASNVPVLNDQISVVADMVEVDSPLAIAAAMLDPAYDFIGDVHFGEPVSAKEIPAFELGRRVCVLGLSERDEWEIVSTEGRYEDLRVGVQLVDRQGPLNEGHLAVFCEQVNAFAEKHGGVATFPRREDKLRIARELDRLCAQMDAIIGLNVVSSRNPFPISRVQACAEGAGLKMESDGVFYARTESGRKSFVLMDRHNRPLDSLEDTPSVTLLLDVPRVAGGQDAFDKMTDLAQQLALTLGGDLVDDESRSLNPSDLASIRKKLGQIEIMMDEHGMPSGGVVACRLFS
ncbi:hypothetical protein KSF73_15605 [Burkholderiaceae bacterium DAT-1]|nr:hypothetical protein [Burkholderiaceae bacterium DAT-1]